MFLDTFFVKPLTQHQTPKFFRFIPKTEKPYSNQFFFRLLPTKIEKYLNFSYLKSLNLDQILCYYKYKQDYQTISD